MCCAAHPPVSRIVRCLCNQIVTFAYSVKCLGTTTIAFVSCFKTHSFIEDECSTKTRVSIIGHSVYLGTYTLHVTTTYVYVYKATSTHYNVQLATRIVNINDRYDVY